MRLLTEFVMAGIVFYLGSEFGHRAEQYALATLHYMCRDAEAFGDAVRSRISHLLGNE